MPRQHRPEFMRRQPHSRISQTIIRREGAVVQRAGCRVRPPAHGKHVINRGQSESALGNVTELGTRCEQADVAQVHVRVARQASQLKQKLHPLRILDSQAALEANASAVAARLTLAKN